MSIDELGLIFDHLRGRAYILSPYLKGRFPAKLMLKTNQSMLSRLWELVMTSVVSDFHNK